MFKKGDIVRHISSGHIGKVVDASEYYTWGSDFDYSNDVPQLFIKVKFFDLGNKYKDVYEASNFEPYKFPTGISEPVSTVEDWLTPKAERFRKVLEKKQFKNQLANKTKGRVRLDGRR